MQAQDQIDQGEANQALKGAERRRSRRYPCNGFAEVVVFHPESLFRGEIRDVSQSGCFVMTKAHVHMERLGEVDLRFTLNENHYHTLARIIMFRPGEGVGFEFLITDRKTEKMLRDLNRTLSEMAATEPPSK